MATIILSVCMATMLHGSPAEVCNTVRFQVADCRTMPAAFATWLQEAREVFGIRWADVERTECKTED